MLKNYLKIAVRNLSNDKLYSVINIFGLAVGIACCILIGLYVQNEWSFDQFHSKSDRIYRAWEKERRHDGSEALNSATPVPLGQALQDNIPEVEQTAYLYQTSNLVQTSNRADALNQQMIVTDASFFNIFDFKLLRGNPSKVFKNPQSVVITRETARRFFGSEEPMQKTLKIRLGSKFYNFTVTGIIAKAPSNSSLKYYMLLPKENLKHLLPQKQLHSWFNIFGTTYVLLQKDPDPSQLKSKLSSMVKSILGKDVYRQTQFTIGLQPLTDIHHNTDFPKGLATVSDPAYAYILGAIALLILLIACVNFMTLSISKSSSRAQEVGVRKTLGALRQHLMYQFWGEALLMTLLALGLGITFAEILLPFFNELSGTSLQFHYTSLSVAAMLGGVLLISLIAGIYPAFILSGYRPVQVLKGRLSLSADKSLFRKTMVVLQFALSIALIIGTLIVHKQLNYVQNKDLGYQKNKIVVINSELPAAVGEQLIEQAFQRKRLLQNKLNSTTDVSDLAVSSYTPNQMAGWFRLGFRDDQDKERKIHGNIVDADFIPTLGIKVLKGRNFSNENPSDKQHAIIVNQALVDYFGWKHPIGQHLPGPKFRDHEVIGVVENFNYESLHTPVEPLAMAMSPKLLFSGVNNMSISNSPSPRYSLKISSSNLSATMSHIKQGWRQIAPGTPFEYTFVDQALDSQYRQEQRLSKIVTSGSVLAIVIACLGLFGLASLMIARRTKEIGVRKVLGASSSSIVLLVNKEFTKLVAVAFVIAVPIAWYAMQQWLQDFAYRIDIGAGIFLMAGLAALVIAWFTVSYQSVKATLINPVESLKSE